MAQLTNQQRLQIKRSNTAPSDLRGLMDGELGYIKDTNKLYIGSGIGSEPVLINDPSKILEEVADKYVKNLSASGRTVTVTYGDDDTTTFTTQDTRNTAGSTDSSDKLFLIGAKTQGSYPQTYSHDTAWVGTDGCLYSNSTKVSVEGHAHSFSEITDRPGNLVSTIYRDGNTVLFKDAYNIYTEIELGKFVPLNNNDLIDIKYLPQGALERLVKVANQTARFALTTNNVQLGDTVQQTDTGVMYIVVDTNKLNSEAGYQVYTAGRATAVDWSGVENKPNVSYTDDGLMTSADKKKLDNLNVAYATCTTAAGTAEKTVSIVSDGSWSLVAGAMISIYFSNTNTANNPTLNVNGLGAKKIYYGSTQITTSNLNRAGYTNRICTYIYDGTQFRFLSWAFDADTNTQIRVYRQNTSSYNADYPLMASRSLASNIGTAGSDGTYNAVYGLISDTVENIPTVNPYSGEIKVKSLTASGNITAASFVGNASSATKLETARTIALSGGATGTATSFNGTSNITIPVTALDPTKLSSAVAINKGGTGATTAAQALINLGLTATAAELNYTDGVTSNIQTQLDNTVKTNVNTTLNDAISTTWTKYGGRKVIITGNDITFDLSAATGGWACNFASVTDPKGVNTPMLGVYGGDTGLTHVYMGGTYSDPFLKFTNDGQFTFKNVPKVGDDLLMLAKDYIDWFGAGISIPANSDLNTYTTSGKYYCHSGDNAATLTNSPVANDNFTLYVFKRTTGSSINQLIVTLNGAMYMRGAPSSGEFRAWQSFARQTANNTFTGKNIFEASNNYNTTDTQKFIVGNSSSAFVFGGDGLQCFSGTNSTTPKAMYINYYGGDVLIGKANGTQSIKLQGISTLSGNASVIGHSGDTPLIVQSKATNAYVQFKDTSGTNLGYMGYISADSPAVFLSTGAKKIWHEGNFTPGDYLPLAGGNMTGHIYMTGASPSSSTANTSQLIFGTPSSEHLAITSNTGALVLNPNKSSTTNQIVLYLNSQSIFPKGINISSGNLNVSGTSTLTGAVTANSTLTVAGAVDAKSTVKIGNGVTLQYNSTNKSLEFVFA